MDLILRAAATSIVTNPAFAYALGFHRLPLLGHVF
jgi:hypothetical protein